jgi:hypothetical protein
MIGFQVSGFRFQLREKSVPPRRSGWVLDSEISPPATAGGTDLTFSITLNLLSFEFRFELVDVRVQTFFRVC